MNRNSIKSYQDAKAFLGNKKERPFAHNTRIEIDTLDLGHEVITVKYHGHPVVNFYPDGTSTFNSCGWRTLTTKERINWFLPDGFHLYQEKSTWYIVKHGNTYGDWTSSNRFNFADGIAIKDGTVYNDAPMDEQDTIKAQIKAIKAYVKGFVTALFNGEISAPSGGDCWYCLMQTESGESLGDATKNHDHIISHMEESYFVPSLIVNASKNGRLSDFAKSTIAQLWNGESVSDWQKDITARQLSSCLTAYIKHALNIAQ